MSWYSPDLCRMRWYATIAMLSSLPYMLACQQMIVFLYGSGATSGCLRAAESPPGA